MNPKYRFDIVIFNHNRLDSFLNNFNKIQNFSKKDRLTIVSASDLRIRHKEKKEFMHFCKKNNILNYRYLNRKNFGLAEKGRLDFFSGAIGGYDNFNSNYIFSMQEHYLDTVSPWSIWGKELNFSIKGDVVPDSIFFDLDYLYSFFISKNIYTCFCDRNNPMFFEIANKRFIAPNGGNFIFKTSMLKNNSIKITPLIFRRLRGNIFKILRKTCDNSYQWALFMEYFWGELFFNEGLNSYDLKKDLIINSFSKEDFYIGPEDVYSLRNKYFSPFGK